MKFLLETELSKEAVVKIIRDHNKKMKEDAGMMYTALTNPVALPLGKRIAAKTLLGMMKGLTKMNPTFDIKLMIPALKDMSYQDNVKMSDWINKKFILFMDDTYVSYMDNYSMVNPTFSIRKSIMKDLRAKIIEEFK